MAEERTYIKALRENLTKKERLLYNLYDITKQQQTYLSAEQFEYDVFEELMDVKDQMLEELDTLEEGFETIYERVRETLHSHQAEYAGDIREMQNRIREIVSLGAKLRALEERNRTKLESILGTRQQEIKKYQQSSQIANQYYQNMAGGSLNRLSLLDQKK